MYHFSPGAAIFHLLPARLESWTMKRTFVELRGVFTSSNMFRYLCTFAVFCPEALPKKAEGNLLPLPVYVSSSLLEKGGFSSYWPQCCHLQLKQMTASTVVKKITLLFSNIFCCPALVDMYFIYNHIRGLTLTI